AVEDDDIAVRMRLDAEPVLDQREVAVIFPEEPRQKPIVLERDDDALVRNLHLSWACRSGNRVPAKCCQSGLQTSLVSNRHFSLFNLSHRPPAPHRAIRDGIRVEW